MSAIVKIVRGANAGAEAALVDGVAVTLGKGDNCDIILADPTLPDAPLTLEARATGVFVDGERLEPFHVFEYGTAALAVGPADSTWGELVWPVVGAKQEAGKGEEGAAAADAKAKGEAGETDEATGKKDEAGEEKVKDETKKKRGAGCFAFIAIILAILIILAVLWLLVVRQDAIGVRDRLPEWTRGDFVTAFVTNAFATAEKPEAPPEPTARELLEKLADEYKLELSSENERAKLSGNLATRAERLAATAKAYATMPGIELSITDDETLKASLADTIALLGEDELRVVTLTNRVAVLSGLAHDLRRTLEAIATDVPRINNVEVADVRVASPAGVASVVSQDGGSFAAVVPNVPTAPKLRERPAADNAIAPLPVCGVLTTPYPCLVLRNGQRVLEGGVVNGNTVLKIDADSVVVSNSLGRVVWKP